MRVPSASAPHPFSSSVSESRKFTLFVSDRTAFGRERFRVAVAPHKCLITMTFTEAIDSEELHFRRLVDRLTAVVLLQGLQKRPSGRFCVRITTVQNVQIFRPNFKVRM